MAADLGSMTRTDGPTVAIVGSGPAGLFTAQQLRKLLPSASIDILDRLPVPHGLMRYGVAPDHQGTKAVSRQFDRLFERDGVAFFGNVHVGRDLRRDELSDLYDAVVLATGLSGDRRLGIPGEALAGVYGSGSVTRWINSYPESDALRLTLGPTVVVVGLGNVALDVARILLKQPAALRGSDLHPRRLAALTREGVESVTLVGRAPPWNARFDPAMIKEIGQLDDVGITVDWDGRAPADLRPEQAARVAALRALPSRDVERPVRRSLRFRFGLTSRAIAGSGRVEGLTFADADGRAVQLTATSVVTAIGFEAGPDALVAPVGDGGGMIGRELGDGVFAVGWCRTGPIGTIADCRSEARATAEVVADRLRRRGRPGRDGLHRRLQEREVAFVDYAGWLRIKGHEERAGNGQAPRIKTSELDRLLALAHSKD